MHAQDFAKFVASQQISAEDQSEDADVNWDEIAYRHASYWQRGEN
jgi:hypothetical protein